jgi:glycosyltransferase involved in cell wall biosynthesis
VFGSDGDRVSTDRAFILFVVGLADHVEELVLFGRLDPEPGQHEYVLPAKVRFVGLPHYPRLTSIGALLRTIRTARWRFASELDSLDAVWLFGPHPVTLFFAWQARRRAKPVFLGVRQDFPKYVSNRLPSRWWAWAVPAAWTLEVMFRRLARRLPTVVLGEELARKYRAGPAPVLSMSFSLVRTSDIVSLDDALARSWEGPLHVLSVGRLDPEKNPFLLIDALARLRERSPRWRLRIVGTGPLAEPLADRVRNIGLGPAVDMLGYVPNGPRLWDVYRSSTVFLHVSWTEGIPIVLLEAEAAGLPIVATDVGGVRAALGDGERGVLVPPGSVDAVVDALERLEADQALRRALVERALQDVATQTFDAQLERLSAFLKVNSSSPSTVPDAT